MAAKCEDFLVKEATAERPSEENQQAWGEGLAVAIHVLLPLAIAGVLWGRKIILSKILLHLDKACLSVFWPSFSKREKVLKWTMSHLPYLEGGLETIWKDGSQLCTLINSVVPGACPNPHRHWKKPPTHGQALAYKYLGVIPVFTETEFNQKTVTSAIEKTLIEYITGIQQAVSKISHDEELTFSNHYIARGMGLVTGEQYRKTVLYIYPNCKSQQSDNLLINIRGPYNSHGMSVLYGNDLEELYKTMRTSKAEKSEEEEEENRSFLKSLTDDFQNLISLKQDREPSCDIEISIEIEKNRAKIMFIPKNSGVYEVCLTTNGEHIAGSPYNINVEKNRSGIMDDLSEDECKGKSKKRVIPKIIETGPDSKYVYVKYEEKERWRRQRKVSDFTNSSESSNNTSLEEDICYLTIKNKEDKVAGDDVNNNNDAGVNNLNDPGVGVEENEALLQVEVPMKQVLMSELNKLKFPIGRGDDTTNINTIKSQEIRDRIPTKTVVTIKGQEIKDRIAKLESQIGSGDRNIEDCAKRDALNIIDGDDDIKICTKNAIDDSSTRKTTEEKNVFTAAKILKKIDSINTSMPDDVLGDSTASKKIDVFQKIIDSNKSEVQQKFLTGQSSVKTEVSQKLIRVDDPAYPKIERSSSEIILKLPRKEYDSKGDELMRNSSMEIVLKSSKQDDDLLQDSKNSLSDDSLLGSENPSGPVMKSSSLNDAEPLLKSSAKIDDSLNNNKSQLMKSNASTHESTAKPVVSPIENNTSDLLLESNNDSKSSVDSITSITEDHPDDSSKTTMKTKKHYFTSDSNSSMKIELKPLTYDDSSSNSDDKPKAITTPDDIPKKASTETSVNINYASTPIETSRTIHEEATKNEDCGVTTMKLIFQKPTTTPAASIDIKKSIDSSSIPSLRKDGISNVTKRIQRLTNIPKPSILHRGKGLRLNIGSPKEGESQDQINESMKNKKFDTQPTKAIEDTQRKINVTSPLPEKRSTFANKTNSTPSGHQEFVSSINVDFTKASNYNNESSILENENQHVKSANFSNAMGEKSKDNNTNKIAVINEKRSAFEKEATSFKPPIRLNNDIPSPRYESVNPEIKVTSDANPIEETASPVFPNTETEVLPRNPQTVSDVSPENIKETATTGKGKLRKWKTVDEPEIPALQITQVDGKTDDENLDLRLSFMKRKEFWHKITSSPNASLNSSCVSLNFDINNDRRYNSLSRLQVKKPKLQKRYSLKEMRANNPQQFRSLDFIDKRRIQRSDSWVLRDKYGSLDDLNFPSVKERRGLFLKEIAQPETKSVWNSKQLKPVTRGLIHKLEERAVSKEARRREVLQERRPKHFFGSIHDKIKLFDSGFNPGKKRTVKTEEPKDNTALKDNWERKLNQLPENGTIKTKIKERFEKAQMFFKTLENVKEHRSDQHFKSSLMRRHSLGSNTVKLEMIKTGGSLRNLSVSERLPLNTLSKDHSSSVSLFSSYSSNGDSKYDYEEVKKLQVNLFLLNNKKRERKSIHNIFN